MKISFLENNIPEHIPRWTSDVHFVSHKAKKIRNEKETVQGHVQEASNKKVDQEFTQKP